MVSTGRFVDREKRFSLLIDVMADIRREIPRAVLVLVGDGPDRRRYEQAIKSRGLEDTVRLEPWRHDLPSFLKSFDVFLQASNYEGWGRACVEAAAAGLPVITTDVGLAGELLIDGVSALVVPVGDREALSRAVVRLYSNPQERRGLARAAGEAVDRLPFRSMNDYYRAYRGAVEACLKR
jgi:glycosyltransferase involved in cell wall biosynthesis